MTPHEKIIKQTIEQCASAYDELVRVTSEFSLQLYFIANNITEDKEDLFAGSSFYDAKQNKVFSDMWCEEEVHNDSNFLQVAANDELIDENSHPSIEGSSIDSYAQVEFKQKEFPALHAFHVLTETMAPKVKAGEINPREARDYLTKAQAAIDQIYNIAIDSDRLGWKITDKPNLQKKTLTIAGV